MDDDRLRPISRHLGVLGIINLSSGRELSAQEIAEEVHFTAKDVERLLSDVEMPGYLRKASGLIAGRPPSP